MIRKTEFTSTEVVELVKLAIADNQDRRRKHVEKIKACNLFFKQFTIAAGIVECAYLVAQWSNKTKANALPIMANLVS